MLNIGALDVFCHKEYNCSAYIYRTEDMKSFKLDYKICFMFTFSYCKNQNYLCNACAFKMWDITWQRLNSRLHFNDPRKKRKEI